MSTKKTSKKTTTKKVTKASKVTEVKKEPIVEQGEISPRVFGPGQKGISNTTPEVKESPIEEKKNDVIGSLKGWKEVHQAGHLRVQAVRTVVPARELPEDIRRWLMNKGYGTNVYLKSKEWLEKHNVDPVMLEKLKKFINDKYL